VSKDFFAGDVVTGNTVVASNVKQLKTSEHFLRAYTILTGLVNAWYKIFPSTNNPCRGRDAGISRELMTAGKPAIARLPATAGQPAIV